jgi:hypothetical protein
MTSGQGASTLVAHDPYRMVVLAKAPVDYWRLGERDGPIAIDASGNGYDGNYSGNPNFGEPGAISHDRDTAVGLNGYGSGDFIEIPDQDGAPFSQQTSGAGLTVEVWMRPDVLVFPGQTSDPYIHWLGKGVPSQYEWGLRFYSQGSSRPNRISAYLWNSTGGEGAGAYFEDVLTPGVWLHVVACYEPGNENTSPLAGVHIYRNGVHRLGPPSPGTLYQTFGISPANGPAPVRLGARDNLTFTFAGALDEVAIYARVLRAAEVLENYKVGTRRRRNRKGLAQG